MDKIWTVYVHTNKLNGKKYVGITSKSVEERWDSGHGYYRQMFYLAIQKYGWNNFEHEIIETNLTEQEAKSLECLYIGMWNTKDRNHGYNLTYGGEGTRGYKHSEESRRRLSERLKGRNNFTGHRHSEKSKEKIRNSLIGHKHSEETKKKIGAKSKGRNVGLKRIKETRKKISETRIKNKIGVGRIPSEESRKKMRANSKSAKKVICLDTGIVFNSMVQCAEAYGTRRETVYTWLNGSKNKHNLTFMYYEDYLKQTKL